MKIDKKASLALAQSAFAVCAASADNDRDSLFACRRVLRVLHLTADAAGSDTNLVRQMRRRNMCESAKSIFATLVIQTVRKWCMPVCRYEG